jgi:type IV pilus assembly protein PilE
VLFLCHPCSKLQTRFRKALAGFTLIELLIVVALIGVLAAVAVPIYSEYVLRGHLSSMRSVLTDQRAKMALYYQGNRSYVGTSTAAPCISGTTYYYASATSEIVVSSSSSDFAVTCAMADTTFTLTASGTSGLASGFIYTIDQLDTKTTTSSSSSSWGSKSWSSCWATRKNDAC